MSYSDIEKHLTKDQKHIRKIERSTAISVEELYELFKWYLKFNADPNLEIGDIKGNYKGVPWIWVHKMGTYYHINADTKLRGVKEFYSNRQNNWAVIDTESGNSIKVTNDDTKNPIEGFYMYKG